MTVTVDHLRGYLIIDKDRLDEELVAQPQLFFTISEAFVDAVDRRDALKEELAVVEADLDSLVREAADKNDEKITNAAVAARVRSDLKRKKAFASYSKVKAETDKLGALKEAFIQRSHMLKHLCELHVANYYEQNSFRGTNRQDSAVYIKQREKIAANFSRKNRR